MPTSEEKKAIAKIARDYHVSLERAERIYWGHRQNVKKNRPLAGLKRRSLAFKKRR